MVLDRTVAEQEEKAMIAEVVAIGDELTSGQRLDTNSQWLSQQLGDLGVRVLYHTTVGDDLQANVAVFRAAAERADLIIATGGLGPTADDLTRQALADAANVDLVEDEAALQSIRRLFSARGREMPERNTVQALFPRGSQVIPNPHGTAPGIYQQFKRSPPALGPARLFALPGVPAEMREMWAQTVQPTIEELLGAQRRVIRHARIKCFGVGESDLEQMLPDLVRRGRRPTVGITVSQATITLRISAEGADDAECANLIAPTAATIKECLGELVFGSEDDELQHAVLRMLAQRKQTLTTLEWGPGGLLSHWLSEADPDSEVFLGGTIVRREGALGRLLADLKRDQAEFSAVLTAALENARQQHGADYGLAIGPFPPNTGESNTRQSPRVVIGVTSAEETLSKEVAFTGHPAILKPRCAKQALNLLRLMLNRNG